MSEQEVEKEIDECFFELTALIGRIPDIPIRELEDHLELVSAHLLATQGDIMALICDSLKLVAVEGEK